MIVSLDETNFDAALDLLSEGFSEQTRSFFEAGLQRMHQFAQNRDLGVPLGRLLLHKDNVVGVVLTPASCRVARDGTRTTIVNLSSWYVEPEHRWRAPLMLRAAFRQTGVTFTDLTPRYHLYDMLLSFGFRQIATHQAAIALPIAALGGIAKTQVCDILDIPDENLQPETRTLMLTNIELGCIGFAIRGMDQWHPLLFKRTFRFGLQVARLIYCDDISVLFRQLPTVAKCLLRSGSTILLVDISSDIQLPRFSAVKRKAPTKFAKGEWPPGRTDYASSELVFFLEL